ncbi:hypothetical protein [Sphingomonas hankyongi]|uniref:Resolvase/invertase-type recombinase catalytic domain-containing protein n=1 Tax=Sphingomonas hankyongi TaxID=2908209 RepID=A0ABT0S1N2_9SPHN|nr:hypothetical protein [Sphingomonas hankyongi]MCL6729780.1 hypothetical protein [Sphingomonas hankyongi]
MTKRLSRLGPEGHFLEKPLDSLKSLGALDRQMQRLRLKLVVAGVEEGDDRRGRTEVLPGALEDIILSLHLFG